MKRLPILFAFLITAFTTTLASAQVNKEQMIADWQRAKAYTKTYLDAMPANGYSFKPTPEMRTFAAQMLHLADGNYSLIGGGTGKPNPLGKVSAEKTISQTKEATTKAVMESFDYAISAIQGMTQAQLLEVIKFGGKDLTRATVINKAFEHQTHHMGQTTVYLRLKGVKPPEQMLF